MPDEESVGPQNLDLIKQSVDSQLTEASIYESQNMGAGEGIATSGDVAVDPKKEEELLSQSDADPDLNRRRQQAEIDKLEENLSNLKQDRDERKKYARRIFVLLCIWLAFDGVVLIAEGLLWGKFFYLSDSVVIALIGSTTASVVGIFLIVVTYLFPKGKD